MGIQEFGNAFRKAVAENANKERKEKIYPRNWSRRKAAGWEDMQRNSYYYPHYAPNEIVGSRVIDSWWAIFQGVGNDDNPIYDDNSVDCLPGNGNPYNISLKDAATDEGNVQLPNDINVEINHARGASDTIDLTGGVNEDWRDSTNHAQIGYLLGLLYAKGYDHWDIFVHENNLITVRNSDLSPVLGGYVGLSDFDKWKDWQDNFTAVDTHTTPIVERERENNWIRASEFSNH